MRLPNTSCLLIHRRLGRPRMLTLGHASIDRPDGLYGNGCFSLVELCVWVQKTREPPEWVGPLWFPFKQSTKNTLTQSQSQWLYLMQMFVMLRRSSRLFGPGMSWTLRRFRQPSQGSYVIMWVGFISNTHLSKREAPLYVSELYAFQESVP